MKVKKDAIAALLAFRNENAFMSLYMKNMHKVADAILGYDDGSTDGSASNFVENGGILVSRLENREGGQGASLEIREHLLSEGRRMGFSSFIILDCDEVIISKSYEALREKITTLSAGDKIVMKWVMSDSSGTGYLNERSVWSPRDKDFAFKDAPGVEYPKNRRFVHFSRTPSVPNYDVNFRILDFEESFVLHFQFLNWELGQIKQCWYRMHEVLKLGRSYRSVNETYAFTKERQDPAFINRFDPSLSIDFSQHQARNFDPKKSWFYNDIVSMVQNMSKFRVRNIDVWHLEIMQTLYQSRFGTSHSYSHLANYLEISRLRFIHLTYLARVFWSKVKDSKNG